MKITTVARELLILTFATAIIAAAVFFFLIPSRASISSISGLAIILRNFIPLQVSTITLILNIVLLIAGFLTCGLEFGYKTVYTSILLPLLIGLFEIIFPDFTSLTNDQVLDAVCYVFSVSIGLAILFNRNASSGGLDIVAKIINRYFHTDLGRALFLSGLCIAFSSALVSDSKTVIISVLGTYFNGLVVDNFIFDQNLKRRVCIVSPFEEEIREYILHELHSGATIYKAIGAYHMDEHNEIITIVDKSEFQKLMSFMSKTDPQAFITVYKVSNMQYRSKMLPERIFSKGNR
ncbi:MAG: YitT family protein [Sphaerochaetaceae bacterium]|nr:YitT family protein [Sphaerochaetaceae bacterium]